MSSPSSERQLTSVQGDASLGARDGFMWYKNLTWTNEK